MYSRFRTSITNSNKLFNKNVSLEYRYDLAEEVGAIATRNSDTFEVCGSPSEAENDPFHGHLYHFVQPGQASIYEKMTDVNMRRKEAATTAWTTNAVFDNTSQLRQRIAWALSQILVASTKSIGRDEYTEMWTNYHDIFLTHAFGNYRDVLKEVTYSPVMADYLTYVVQYSSEKYSFFFSP